MSSSSAGRFVPVIILALVAALVTVLGLWSLDRARSSDSAIVSAAAAGEAAQYEWRIVTTWPKGLPGLGSYAENFARYIEAMSNGRLRARV